MNDTTKLPIENIIAIRRAVVREYEEAIKRVGDLVRQIEAIDQLIASFGLPEEPPVKEYMIRKLATAAVAEARRFQGEFTIAMISENLGIPTKDKSHRLSIQNAVTKMRERGEIRRVRERRGQTPAVYVNVGANDRGDTSNNEDNPS